MDRRVSITKGKGKLRGRACVKVRLGESDKHANPRRKNLRGNAAPIRFYGCFKSAQKARQVAAKLQRARRLA